jgi:hypothetical protein
MNLRLDQRASLLRGADHRAPAIIPGYIEVGELLKSIHRDDEKFRMPCDESPRSIVDQKLIATWIAGRANWSRQMHAVAAKPTNALWSMQPVMRPEIPRFDRTNCSRVSSIPI